MAPRKSDGAGKAAVTTPPRQTRSMDRKTRSQTQRNSSGSSSPASKLMTYESPEKRKRKSKAKESGSATKKIKQEKEDEPAVEAKKPEEEDDVAAKEEEDDAAAMEEEDDVAAKEEEDDVAAKEEEDSENKKIVIEHCKQCKSFKERAKEVKAGLEKAVPGILVTLNADKPRRGCFEIREEGGETFISLLDMKRPFKEMKDLDMEQVIADIVEKLK